MQNTEHLIIKPKRGIEVSENWKSEVKKLVWFFDQSIEIQESQNYLVVKNCLPLQPTLRDELEDVFHLEHPIKARFL